MISLKTAYYYILAVKINFIKVFKKIYFTTRFYRKSLISKIPSQFFFLPNPFLMESIISNNGKPISIPHKKQAKKRLKIGCQLNFDVVIIMNKIDNAKYKNIIILILY